MKKRARMQKRTTRIKKMKKKKRVKKKIVFLISKTMNALHFLAGSNQTRLKSFSPRLREVDKRKL